MEHYLIDNNVISSYFAGLFSEKAVAFMVNVIDQIPNLSVITEIEALSWINIDKNKEAILQGFIKESNILYITSDIAHKCISIILSFVGPIGVCLA